MNRETINPKDEQEWLQLRTQDVTSTEVAALFGISPYTTLFELWHRKRDQVVVELEPNERMAWGNALQDGIAAKIAKDNNWLVRRMMEYMRIPDLRLGASFDFSIEGTPLTPDEYSAGKRADWPEEDCALLEIKNVDSLQFRQGWIVDDDGIEAPPHIELQVQQQLMVSGRSQAKVCALVGGNRGILMHREPDPSVHKAIINAVNAFWGSIRANEEPRPDFRRDADFISKLYGYAEPGKVLDAAEDESLEELFVRYKGFSAAAAEANALKDAVKAEILIRIGDAERVLGKGYTLNAGIVGECPISYTRKAYRNFKATWKKPKETS